MKIQDSTVLITGANRGIGRAFVEAFLAAGAQKIYATSRQRDSLADVVALDPQRIIPLQIDITDSKHINSLAEQAPDVNLLINNAGILAFGNILEVPAESVAQQFETNFYGPLNMARVFVPLFEQQGGGAIVNVLTLLSLASMPGMSAYNASKAAAWSMTLSLRASVADKNIQVYSVFPGAVDTDMLAGIEMPKTSPETIAQRVIAGIEAGQEDIFPDPMSTQIYTAWRQDHKAVEKQFAAM